MRHSLAVAVAVAVAIAIAIASLPAAASADGKDLALQPASTITYRLVHKFHEFQGVSRAPEGVARLLPDGTLQVMARAKVESFDSANANRDAHMKEVVDAAANPLVQFKGVGHGVKPPERLPADQTVKVAGRLLFHGVELPQDVELKVHWDDADHARATGTFTVSLEQYKIERPSLLFVKVDDAMKVDLDLDLALAGRVAPAKAAAASP